MNKKIFAILALIALLASVNCAAEEPDDTAGYQADGQGLEADSASSNSIYLTLEQVCNLALNNNLDIQLAEYDAKFKETDLDKVSSIYDTFIQAEIEFDNDRRKSASSFAGTKSEARDYNIGVSQKLPTGTTLGVDFDNQRSWTNAIFTTTNPAYESSFSLSLEQELGRNFFGIKDRSEIRITRNDIQNAEYTSLDKIEQMLAQVQKTYYSIVKDLNIVQSRQDMLVKAKDLFQINQDKINRGIIESPQLLASEANLKQKEIDLILADNELQLHINELKLLLNLEDLDKDILPQENFDGSAMPLQPPASNSEENPGIGLITEPLELSRALKTALQSRRDYLKAKNEADSKDIQLVMKENNLWPEINLEASFTRNGIRQGFSNAISDVSSEDNPEYYLGLSVSFPLQNREAKSEFDKAKIEKAQALLSLKKIERQIFIQINDSVRECQILEQRAIKQENVVRLQEEKLSAELKRYQYGRSDTDTVIRYQDDLLLSRILYVQSILDYKVALIDLALRENVLLDGFWKASYK